MSARLEGPQANRTSGGEEDGLRSPDEIFSPLCLGLATTPWEPLRRARDGGRRPWDPGEECGWLRSRTPVVGEFGDGSKRSVTDEC